MFAKQSHQKKTQDHDARTGRAWRAIKLGEVRFARWLVHIGAPASLAVGAIWSIRLFVVGSLLAAAMKSGLLTAVAFLAIIALIAGSKSLIATDAKDDLEWRNGTAGYGQYRGDIRVDAHVTEDEAR